MKYIFLISLPLLFPGKPLAQSNWQISVSSGAISSEFLIDSPLGVQFEGAVFYEILDSVQLSLLSGFNKWENSSGIGGNKFKSIPLFAGIKHSFPLGVFSPYLAAELGLHFITREFIFQVYTPSERFEGLYQLVSSVAKTESVSKFAFRFGFGSAVAISSRLGADLNIRYNNISYDYIFNYNPSALNSSEKLDFYSFSIGLNFKI